MHYHSTSLNYNFPCLHQLSLTFTKTFVKEQEVYAEVFPVSEEF